MFFEFKSDGDIGVQIADPLTPGAVDRKPYYILNNAQLQHSDYVVVGTRTPFQEATFFTDIPPGWITNV